MAKLHWATTPEGRKKMAEIARKQHAARKEKNGIPALKTYRCSCGKEYKSYTGLKYHFKVSGHQKKEQPHASDRNGAEAALHDATLLAFARLNLELEVHARSFGVSPSILTRRVARLLDRAARGTALGAAGDLSALS